MLNDEYVCVTMCEYVHVNSNGHRGHRSQFPQELELQMALGHSMWAKETELMSVAKTIHCRATSPALGWLLNVY